jgi:hypothetical protein
VGLHRTPGFSLTLPLMHLTARFFHGLLHMAIEKSRVTTGKEFLKLLLVLS